MNSKKLAKLKVKDLLKLKCEVIDDQNKIDHFNEMYNEDFVLYFIKPLSGDLNQLYAAEGNTLKNNAYYIGEIKL